MVKPTSIILFSTLLWAIYGHCTPPAVAPIDPPFHCDRHYSRLHTDELRDMGYEKIEVAVTSERNASVRTAYIVADGKALTYAATRFHKSGINHPAVKEAHKKVLDGFPIGETLSAAGFRPIKEHLEEINLPLTDEIAARFGVERGTFANARTYRFWLVRPGEEPILYGTITEWRKPVVSSRQIGPR